MNFKTTVFLAFILVALGGMYFWSKQVASGRSENVTVKPQVLPGTSEISRPVLDKQLGDIVRIACTPENKEEWVFEKTPGPSTNNQPVWRITAPISAKAISWEVQRFATQLTNIKYEISYGTGGAVSAADAGLAPPEAVVTLTDHQGQSATFEIGLDATPTESFVRLQGTEDIRVGQGVLSSLIKSNILDYRDNQLWSFNKDDATRLELTDRSGDTPTNYIFSCEGEQWMLESPVTAKATNKIVEVLRTMSILRVNKWVDDREDRLPLYGLEPPALTVKVTTEKTIEPEIEDPDSENAGETESEEPDETPQPPRIETETYVLHVSTRSPIGEDTKVYVRPDGETATGTIMKTLADRFTPDLSEWRDMKLTSANVTGATQVDISTPAGNASLSRKNRDWLFLPENSIAESQAVRELLLAVNDLEAVAFVDDPGSDPNTFGLDNPQAQIRITVPGVEEPERLTIGAYTDQRSRRLVYLRRNEMTSIAKVRVADVEKLLRSPRNYRNLSVFKANADDITQINLTTPQACGGEPSSVALMSQNQGWKMTAPSTAPLNQEEFRPFLTQLAGLKADAIVADEGELSAYALHDPQVSIEVTYLSTPIVKLEESTDEEGQADQRIPASIQVIMTEHEGKVYAKRNELPVIYQLPAEFYRRATSEHRAAKIFEVSKDTAASFFISTAEGSFQFEKKDQKWTLAAEPDLPLDDAKVDNLLLQIGDIVTARFVAHTEESTAAYDFANPLMTAGVITTDGKEMNLEVSPSTCAAQPERGHLAHATGGATGVFLLNRETLDRLEVNLTELEK